MRIFCKSTKCTKIHYTCTFYFFLSDKIILFQLFEIVRWYISTRIIEDGFHFFLFLLRDDLTLIYLCLAEMKTKKKKKNLNHTIKPMKTYKCVCDERVGMSSIFDECIHAWWSSVHAVNVASNILYGKYHATN